MSEPNHGYYAGMEETYSRRIQELQSELATVKEENESLSMRLTEAVQKLIIANEEILNAHQGLEAVKKELEEAKAAARGEGFEEGVKDADERWDKVTDQINDSGYKRGWMDALEKAVKIADKYDFDGKTGDSLGLVDALCELTDGD